MSAETTTPETGQEAMARERAGASLRQRISDALLAASCSMSIVGRPLMIEVPLDVAADAVMSVLGSEGER